VQGRGRTRKPGDAGADHDLNDMWLGRPSVGGGGVSVPSVRRVLVAQITVDYVSTSWCARLEPGSLADGPESHRAGCARSDHGFTYLANPCVMRER
jgi:hypothetical protein